MDDKAENQDDLEPNETPDETTPEAEGTPGASFDDGDEVVVPEAEGEETEGEEDDQPGDGQEDSGEVEIVREGDTQPTNEVPRGFLKRVGKLNGKIDKAKQETAQEREKREFLEDENRVLKVALDQARGVKPEEPQEIPDPDKFDGGIYDPDYIREVNIYNQKQIQEGIKAGLAEMQKEVSTVQAKNNLAKTLETQQMSHYERAAKLGVKDYEATEDKAIEIFGLDHTNHLIANLDNSEVALYYFGKNPEVAHKFAEKLKTQPIKALIEMGTHLAGVKVKKGGKSTLPDPDEELEGGTRSGKKQRGPKGATFA
jgi:hypothetical protein